MKKKELIGILKDEIIKLSDENADYKSIIEEFFEIFNEKNQIIKDLQDKLDKAKELQEQIVDLLNS